jgi:hypothetical protein
MNSYTMRQPSRVQICPRVNLWVEVGPWVRDHQGDLVGLAGYDRAVTSEHDDVPAGFSFPRSSQLHKAPPPRKFAAVADATDSVGVDDHDKKSQAVVAAAAPAAPGHGRPVGAGNALAFHAWKKAPPNPPSSH